MSKCCNSARLPQQIAISDLQNNEFLPGCPQSLYLTTWTRSNSARPLEMASWVQSCLPCTNVFCLRFFHSMCLKYCACHENMGQVIQSAAPVTQKQQHHLSKPEDLMLQNATVSGHLPREVHLCRSSSTVLRLPLFLGVLQNPHVWFTFHKVQNSLHLPCKAAP